MDRTPPQTQERQAVDALETLWMFLTAMAGVEDEYERARLTATGIPSLLPCCVSGMALRQETGAGYTLVLQRQGRQLSAIDTEPVLAESIPRFEEAMGRGPMLMSCADSTPHGGLFPHSLVSLGVQSLAVVPIRTLHHLIGILLVGKGQGEGFTRQEEFILQMLAERSAIAIENTRLQQALQRYAQRLQELVDERTAQLRQSEERQRVLLEINNAIIANLDRASLFHAITQALRDVLPFDRATLTLYEPGRDILKVFALAGVSPEHFGGVGTEVSRQGSHVGWVFEHRAPLLRCDLEQEYQFSVEEKLLAEGIRSYIVVPLITKDKAFGTLNIGSLVPYQYGGEDAAFLVEVAKQVALAVDNMLAYEKIAELKARLEQESLYLQEEIKTQHNFEEIIGQSPAMQKVLQAVETVAPTNASVLILGETGTGKELIARALHHLSPRPAKPLVKVNCAALPAGLIESELFGHERGAFTGALSRRLGRFELAHGGTIFLDEVGELPLELQVKLLRVLQEGEFERVGGADTIKVDVRVVAATNRDLTKAMQEGRFRQDLFYRLHVFPIQLPPLRERREDIPLLVKYFAMKYSKRFGKRIATIPHKTMVALQAYPWPGNVRELEHVVERAVILSQGPSSCSATGCPPLPRPLTTYGHRRCKKWNGNISSKRWSSPAGASAGSAAPPSC